MGESYSLGGGGTSILILGKILYIPIRHMKELCMSSGSLFRIVLNPGKGTNTSLKLLTIIDVILPQNKFLEKKYFNRLTTLLLWHRVGFSILLWVLILTFWTDCSYSFNCPIIILIVIPSHANSDRLKLRKDYKCMSALSARISRHCFSFTSQKYDFFYHLQLVIKTQQDPFKIFIYL
jgi:hypothetical protein